MTIESVQNGDSGFSAREKINAAISAINELVGNGGPPSDGAQPEDATLTALAGLATSADKLPYFTGVDTAAVTVLTAFARTLLDDTNAAAALNTLGAQPLDATLTTLAGLATSANKLPYFTGVDTAGLTPLTPAAIDFLAQNGIVNTIPFYSDDDAVGTLQVTDEGRRFLKMQGATNAIVYFSDNETPGLLPSSYAGRDLISVSPYANSIPYFPDANNAAVTALSAFARTLLGDATAAEMLATLGAAPLSHTHPANQVSSVQIGTGNGATLVSINYAGLGLITTRIVHLGRSRYMTFHASKGEVSLINRGGENADRDYDVRLGVNYDGSTLTLSNVANITGIYEVWI